MLDYSSVCPTDPEHKKLLTVSLKLRQKRSFVQVQWYFLDLDGLPLDYNGNWENITTVFEVRPESEKEDAVVMPKEIPSSEESTFHRLSEILFDPRVTQSDVALLRVAKLLKSQAQPAQQCSAAPDFASLWKWLQTAESMHQVKELTQIPSCGSCQPADCILSAVIKYQRAELPAHHSLWERTWKIYALDWHTTILREVQFLMEILLGMRTKIQFQSFVPICSSWAGGACVTDPRLIVGSPTWIRGPNSVCCISCLSSVCSLESVGSQS